MTTKTFDMDTAPPAVADLLSDVLRGDEILVTRGSKPVARIVPVRRTGRREGFGSLRGQIWMTDDFDAPLTYDFDDDRASDCPSMPGLACGSWASMRSDLMG